jgi:hypothetical protein
VIATITACRVDDRGDRLAELLAPDPMAGISAGPRPLLELTDEVALH